jgi:hypothetical protein
LIDFSVIGKTHTLPLDKISLVFNCQPISYAAFGKSNPTTIILTEVNDALPCAAKSAHFAEGAENTIFVAQMSFYTSTLPE